MKEGWDYKKLGEVCDFEGGSQPPKSEWINHPQNGYIRMLQIRDFTKSRNAEIEYVKITKKLRLCKDDDILIGRYGASVGKILTGLAGAYNVAIIKSIPNEELIKKDFIRRYFESPLFQSILFKVCTSRAAQAGFSKDDIKDELIPLPPLSEQQRIVDYLDSAFAKIDAMKANAEKALNEAKALFQASLKEMLEPKEGWEEKTLKEICKVINGRAYSKDEMLKQGKYRLLRVGNFFTNDSWYYSDLELEDDKYCDNGDLLYAWSASFGPRIWDGEKVIYHYHIWKMVCSTEIDKFFLCYWLDSDELKKQTMTNLHGATMAHITKGIIEAARVGFPSLSEQQSIVTTLDSLKSKVDRLQANYEKISQECDALKQAILRQVFE
ncbi:MAG: restriction endonuclease subunit S [Prevotella sp.]|nr:restriction endonuclease subunit S [Prevotella sp.]